jgi:hypothetical protein
MKWEKTQTGRELVYDKDEGVAGSAAFWPSEQYEVGLNAVFDNEYQAKAFAEEALALAKKHGAK